jgi:hypothetical protein
MAPRCLGFGLILTGLLVPLGGCVSTETAPALLPVSRDTPINLTNLEPEPPRVTRSQKPEAERAPAPPPPVEQVVAAAAPPSLPTPPRSSLPTPPSADREGLAHALHNRFLTVRATVNNEPLFDDEIMTAVAKYGPAIMRVPPGPEREAVIAKYFKEELDHAIDTELILQDAYRKLEKNPKFLTKLKEDAAKEFTKRRAKQARELKVTVEELKRLVNKEAGKGTWENLRRQEERAYIAQQYIGSRVFPWMQIRHEDIREVYDKHPEQFQTVDRVQWQDIFIVVGPKHPTMAEARRFAEELLDAVQRGRQFEDFLRFDEGDSWSYRKGEGNGQRRGEIRPPELEPYLFDRNLRDGDIGPIVELSTGVHVFRLLKREYAGQMPFDEKVQQRISNQLRAAIAEREYKRLVKELRERAVYHIVPGMPGH